MQGKTDGVGANENALRVTVAETPTQAKAAWVGHPGARLVDELTQQSSPEQPAEADHSAPQQEQGTGFRNRRL